MKPEQQSQESPMSNIAYTSNGVAIETGAPTLIPYAIATRKAQTLCCGCGDPNTMDALSDPNDSQIFVIRVLAVLCIIFGATELGIGLDVYLFLSYFRPGAWWSVLLVLIAGQTFPVRNIRAWIHFLLIIFPYQISSYQLSSRCSTPLTSNKLNVFYLHQIEWMYFFFYLYPSKWSFDLKQIDWRFDLINCFKLLFVYLTAFVAGCVKTRRVLSMTIILAGLAIIVSVIGEYFEYFENFICALHLQYHALRKIRFLNFRRIL